MKNYIYLLFILIAGKGQTQNLESLKLNSSPGYVVLGVDPQNIQRPNSPTDFIAGVQSAIVNGKLQPNFALETTPYHWIHPKNDDEKKIDLYEFAKSNSRKPFRTMLKTFTLSLASSESDTALFGNLDPGTGFGFGARFFLFQGKINKDIEKDLIPLLENKILLNVYQSLKSQLRVDSPVDLKEWQNTIMKNRRRYPLAARQLLDDMILEFEREKNKSVLSYGDISWLDQKILSLNDSEIKYLKAINNNNVLYPLTREGFMLEVAFANASIVQANEWKNLKSAKTALWLTPSFRINARNQKKQKIKYLDIMAVLRVTWNDQNVDVSDYLDFGARAQYTYNRISFSGEYIARKLTTRPTSVISAWTNRLDISFDYKLNELVTFKATVGRNFDGNSVHWSDPGKMFAVGGFNFGFSNLFNKNVTH